MGQHWRVLNVDRKEEKLVDGRKIREIFRADMGELYQSLRIPCLPKEVDQWLSDGKNVVQRKEIATLSNEILDMIFQAVLNDKREQPGHNLVDCVSLAVSCKRFLSVGKRRILRALVYFHGRDADCRLVCLGESTDPDDQAPPGMLTDAELHEIADPEAPKVLPVDTYDCDERNQPIAEVVAPRRLYSFAAAKYRSRATVTDIIQRSLRHRSREMDGRRKREGPCITASLTLDIHMITVLGCVEYCPHPAYPDGPNALCNTSKGEYILEDELVALKAKDDKINLAHALLSRIFYSSGSSISEAEDGEYANQLAKGPWAGDKFRIVPANKLPVLKGMKEWKDVTEEANNLLCHIWSVYDIAGEGYDTDSDVKEPEVRSTQLPLEAYFPYSPHAHLIVCDLSIVDYRGFDTFHTWSSATHSFTAPSALYDGSFSAHSRAVVLASRILSLVTGLDNVFPLFVQANIPLGYVGPGPSGNLRLRVHLRQLSGFVP